MSGELSKEEIKKCEMDPSKNLEIIKDVIPLSSTLKKVKKNLLLLQEDKLYQMLFLGL